MSTCEWEDFGPDMDGTAGTFPCCRPATHVVSEVCDWNPEPPHAPVQVETLLCAEHLEEMATWPEDQFGHDRVVVEVQK